MPAVLPSSSVDVAASDVGLVCRFAQQHQHDAKATNNVYSRTANSTMTTLMLPAVISGVSAHVTAGHQPAPLPLVMTCDTPCAMTGDKPPAERDKPPAERDKPPIGGPTANAEPNIRHLHMRATSFAMPYAMPHNTKRINIGAKINVDFRFCQLYKKPI